MTTQKNNTPQKSVFDDFTNKYALSKTLRFELMPVGKTRDWMNKNLKYDKTLQTFLIDQEIKDAYKILKPVFDKIHENFITDSLGTKEAKKINFNDYFKIYKKYKLEQNREEKMRIEKILGDKERELRNKFTLLYTAEGENFKKLVGKEKRGNKEEYILKEKGFKTLTESGILKYIKNNIDIFSSLNLKTIENKEVEKKDLEKALGTTKSKGVFEGFFTYFSGFNQNRENYYETKDERATSVATRTINENLPKFCDNTILFQENKSKYLKIDNFLKEKGIKLLAKDQNGKETELHKIREGSFNIDFFITCLTQQEIEQYNLEVGNANNLINRYNQQQDNKNDKLKLFKTLYKQIGCGNKEKFIPSIENFEELKKVLNEIKIDSINYFKQIGDFCDYIKKHETFENIYWSDKAVNIISAKYFSDWYTLKQSLWGKKDKSGNLKDEEPKLPQAVHLKDLFTELNNKDKDWKNEGVLFKTSLFSNGKKFLELREKNKKIYEKDQTEHDNNINKFNIIEKSKNPSEALLEIVFTDIESKKTIFLNKTNEVLQIKNEKDSENKRLVKEWLDSVLNINQIIKYWKVKDKFGTDGTLDEKIRNILLSEKNPTRFYDIVRNYLTKKTTGGLNKLKLNFENSQLLGGWSNGQEKNKGGVILQKENEYYVGILNKKSIFDTEKPTDIYNEKGDSARLILMNLKFQTLAGKGFLKDNDKKSYSDMGKENPLKAINALQKLIIDRKYAERYPKLKIIAEKKYQNKKDFDKELQETLKDCYVCEFKKTKWGKIEEYINSGELYVFKIICNQRVVQNLYWNEVFRKDSTAQLLGGAEVFYRPQNKEIKKETKNGYENKKDNLTNESYIIKNKRFTKETFLFHCPVKLNYREKDYGKPQYATNEVNKNINELLKNNKNTCFLGIDRGEKHLVYYSLIDQSGKILEQGSLNEINGENYAEKLEKIAKDRNEARKNWQTIGKIKELKDGYISQAVRQIVDLAIKNNAFIVLENLSIGFKRGRQKIEKQVYQKLELALAKKLNFLVNKGTTEGEPGSVTKALQLTPPVNNFGDIDKAKQFGIMLYTKADYTSQTDPITGWRKTIYLKRGSEDYIKNQILKSFDDIDFDGKDYYFRYTDVNTNNLWTLYPSKNGKNLDRFFREYVYENSEKQWVPKKQDLLKMLDDLFAGFDKKLSLLKQLKNGKNPNKIDGHTAWESLRFVIDLIQQIRNTGVVPEDEDFIYSPVRDGNNNHFDSRKAGKDQPSCGDANGAYNIAKKGIIMNEHIKNDLNLFIRDEEWSNWLIGKEKWEKWVKNNKNTLKKPKDKQK